jgi:hypothetical protein
MGFHVRDQRDGGMISAISEPKRRLHFTHYNPIRRQPLPCGHIVDPAGGLLATGEGKGNANHAIGGTSGEKTR